MRLQDWDKRLLEALKRHNSMPGAYGTSDCLIMTLDCIKAVTGSDPYPHDQFDRKYKNEKGALKCLKKAGFKDVRDALAAKFPTVPVSQAARGDVGVILHEGIFVSGVFFTGGFKYKTMERVASVPWDHVHTAFAVR